MSSHAGRMRCAGVSLVSFILDKKNKLSLKKSQKRARSPLFRCFGWDGVDGCCAQKKNDRRREFSKWKQGKWVFRCPVLEESVSVKKEKENVLLDGN